MNPGCLARHSLTCRACPGSNHLLKKSPAAKAECHVMPPMHEQFTACTQSSSAAHSSAIASPARYTLNISYRQVTKSAWELVRGPKSYACTCMVASIAHSMSSHVCVSSAYDSFAFCKTPHQCTAGRRLLKPKAMITTESLIRMPTLAMVGPYKLQARLVWPVGILFCTECCVPC